MRLLDKGEGEHTIVSVIIGIGVQLVGGVAPELALCPKLLVAEALTAWRTIGRVAALKSHMGILFILNYGCDIFNAMSSAQGCIFT